MSVDIDKFDESVLGSDSPDPLRFAFVKKHSAHAGGASVPVPPPQQAGVLSSITSDRNARNNKRCLYIHVPFCRVRCTFCNFFQNAASRTLVDEYFAALMQELKEKAALPWTQSGIFHAVYIGGGTPTDLSPEQVRMLGQAIHDYFPLASDCEITLEGRINRFSDELYQGALDGGFNRFSFGVQSFNTQVRRSAKRLDDREDVLKRVSELAKEDKIPVIIDLLYGLPYQTKEILEQDLNDFMSTGAHGLDLYQLVVGGTAPMLNLVEKGKIPPPATTPEKAGMYELGVNFMAKRHMKQLSVNHWAVDNRERSLYNSLAKTYAEVLPIGCGAGGNIGGYGMMLHRTLDTYIKAVNEGQSTIAMMMKHSPLEPLFAALKSGFDRGIVQASKLPMFMGSDTFDFLMPLFKVWQDKGLVELQERSLVLTLAGSFWAVSLAQACIQVLTSEMNESVPKVSNN
ncbi:heme anaerobic degradation radical SAM methyltransferase ChuW/HutW [Vibrio parahaemolyticus]|uniref:heme anaerobic degradation radical SAM methyltransferase ChuW/HutW n=1 Tax=Vibrio parahaemolyticus TaxID=670 RepID=UPI00084B07FF|nr:heme anaerobic degradation radical SAM methyltransferase ChuW/HutW [Vibrio parahaemolyticus]EJG1717051.1 heme anaerobic degradation radical SAM methyltransferase ChuW/HutW [Vibrio parahaemolyticus]ODZ52657.1 putative heme utilization radical SAM enzyme HutW [Vibrio parahaemolyticus]ODZ59918.1 putative heme utilization radical SAM enzyme HutW [Vibrio parahaemolyticus]OQK34504.1 Coproporphyrinogen III oxidase [Vibrio parahaemolyticus]TOQ09363.1 putative heme utilization radical SAM enzyme Hut